MTQKQRLKYSILIALSVLAIMLGLSCVLRSKAEQAHTAQVAR